VYAHVDNSEKKGHNHTNTSLETDLFILRLFIEKRKVQGCSSTDNNHKRNDDKRTHDIKYYIANRQYYQKERKTKSKQ